MYAGLQHQLEIHADAATLYLSGRLQASDLPRLRAICVTLPEGVSVLRVDLHGLVAPAPEAVGVVRAMLQEWRNIRGGTFRLALRTTNLVASYREGHLAEVPTLPAACAQPHALMATFL